MTERKTWTPSPELANETRAVLMQLARRWPKAMAAALDRTESGLAYLGDFAFALRDVDLRVMGKIGREYLAENDFPPGPHELRVLAQRIEVRDYPKPAPDPLPPPPVHTGKDLERIAEVGRVLRAELGSLPLVMLAWEHIGTAAQASPEAAHAFRSGKVTPEAVAAAITAVRPKPAEVPA